MERIKVTYSVSGFGKFVIGTLLWEDATHIVIESRDGKQFKILKATIVEEKRWKDDYRARTTKAGC